MIATVFETFGLTLAELQDRMDVPPSGSRNSPPTPGGQHPRPTAVPTLEEGRRP